MPARDRDRVQVALRARAARTRTARCAGLPLRITWPLTIAIVSPGMPTTRLTNVVSEWVLVGSRARVARLRAARVERALAGVPAGAGVGARGREEDGHVAELRVAADAVREAVDEDPLAGLERRQHRSRRDPVRLDRERLERQREEQRRGDDQYELDRRAQRLRLHCVQGSQPAPKQTNAARATARRRSSPAIASRALTSACGGRDAALAARRRARASGPRSPRRGPARPRRSPSPSRARRPRR